MSKYQEWYDNLPAHTQVWLKNQPIWHDSDLFKMFILGFFIGLCIGFIL